MAEEFVIRVAGVEKRYAGQEPHHAALRGVSFRVPRDGLIAVAGPSGSGKSTLLALVGCLDRPTQGTVRVEGVDVGVLSRGRRRAFRRDSVSNLLPLPSDNLLHRFDGLTNVRRARQGRGPLGQDEAVEMLERFGIGHCGSKRVAEMSGGEQQRLALVCALVRGPRLIVADEPTSSLDRPNAHVVIEALQAAAALGTTVIVATHDHDLIAAATASVHLSHGAIVSLDDALDPMSGPP